MLPNIQYYSYGTEKSFLKPVLKTQFYSLIPFCVNRFCKKIKILDQMRFQPHKNIPIWKTWDRKIILSLVQYGPVIYLFYVSHALYEINKQKSISSTVIGGQLGIGGRCIGSRVRIDGDYGT